MFVSRISVRLPALDALTIRRFEVSLHTMKAVVVENHKAAVRDIEKPVPPPGEVLIAVRLAGICATDLEIIKGYADDSRPAGAPRIIGHEFVGTVVEGGKSLANQRVVGEINCVCGRCDMCQGGLANHCRKRSVLGICNRAGAFAEYVCLPEQNCVPVPDALTDEEAVFAEPLAAAIQITRQVKLESRTNVAVLGTGRLGLLVAQVLATTGCKLTAIGRQRATLALLDRLRIRNVHIDELTHGVDYDVVIECTGSPSGLPLALKLVRPRGTIVIKTTCAEREPVDLSDLVVNEVTLLGSRCGPMRDALAMLATRRVDTTGMVSRTFPLADAEKALAAASEPGTMKVLLKP